MRIHTKFILMLVILSVVMAAGTILPGYLKMREFEYKEAVEYAERKLREINRDIERQYEVLSRAGVLEIESYTVEGKNDLLDRLRTKNPNSRANLLVIDPDGSVLLSIIEHESLAFQPAEIDLLTRLGSGKVIHHDTENKWHLTIDNNNVWGWVIVAAISDREVFNESWGYLRFVMSIGGLVFLAVLVAYAILSRNVRKRLDLVANYLNNYSSGDGASQVSVRGSDEIATLLSQINSMIDSIESGIESRKIHEHQLEQARDAAEKANAAKSEFLANMSHEIRNPLNVIAGFSEVLANTRLDKAQGDAVNNILHASQILKTTLTNILDITKIEQQKIDLHETEFDLHRELETTFGLFLPQGKEKSLDMNCAIDSAVPSRVIGDRGIFSRIVTNLVDNAVKYTEKGEINVHAEVLDETETIVTLKFTVKDTGIGIAADRLPEVFNTYTQIRNQNKQNNEGAGLGLAIVNGIVETLGGSVQLKSTDGAGSEFTVVLPFRKVRNEPSTQSHSTDNTGVVEKSIKALVVDDDILNRAYIGEVLGKSGVDFDTAENGKEAVSMVENHLYDIVFMDIRMPIMNGGDAIQHIRSKVQKPNCDVPIVVLTANAIQDDINHYLEIGASAFITKPFETETLLATLGRFVLL